MKRFLSRAAVLVVAGGIALLGNAPPAHAQNVDYTDGCGSVEVQVRGFPDDPVTVQRNQVTIITITLDEEGRNQVTIGATAGDRLTINSMGSTEHIYQPPAGCTLPAIDISDFPLDGCDGNAFIFADNQQSTPVVGQVSNGEGQVFPVEFVPGETLTAVARQPFDRFRLEVQLGSELVLWLNHRIGSEPDECQEPTLAQVQFFEDCDGVTVTVENAIDRHLIYSIQRVPEADEPLAVGFTTVDGPSVHTFPAEPGDGFRVVLLNGPRGGDVATLPNQSGNVDGTPVQSAPLGAGEAVDRTYTGPADCDSGGQDGGSGGGDGDGGDGAGGSLPITGAPAGLAVAAGVTLLLVGLGLVLLGRRQRRRFIAGR